MQENEINSSYPNDSKSNFSVVLPCAPDQFSEFVASLLGRPQEIGRHIPGIVEITRTDIENTFHLVDQRVHQQNDSSLIQFNVRIIYDDGSTVLLNKLQDFLVYTEIRAVVSVGVELSWTYLIKFRNKTIPEKQEINLSFFGYRGGTRRIRYETAEIFDYNFRSFGHTLLRINHTERTWGVDIESLLVGHVKNITKTIPKTALFLAKYNEKIGLAVGCLLFISALATVFVTYSKFLNTYLKKVEMLSSEVGKNSDLMTVKINFLIELISQGVWPRFIFAALMFLVILLVLSVFLGAWVSEKSTNLPMSYVLLSRKAEELRDIMNDRLRRDWYLFALSIIASVVTGIISSWIFNIYFSGTS